MQNLELLTLHTESNSPFYHALQMIHMHVKVWEAVLQSQVGQLFLQRV